MQGMKIQELQKNIEETTSLAGEESFKLRVVKEFLKSMTDQVSFFVFVFFFFFQV